MGRHTAGGAKVKTKNLTRSRRAGIVFPVGRLDRYFRRSMPKFRFGSAAPVYLAAVLEYMTAEILELAGNVAYVDKRARITPRHVFLAVANDEEVHDLLKDVTFPNSGVVPHISSVLLPQKPPKAAAGSTNVKPPVSPKPVKPPQRKAMKTGKHKAAAVHQATALTAVSNVKAGLQSGKNMTVLSERKLHGGQKLTVLQGSITGVTADAYVHPTGSNFYTGGQVGATLVKAGGVALKNEFRNMAGSLAVSGVAICNAPGLTANYVIHVNSPTWGGDNCEEMLHRAIGNIMALASEHKLSSVALPSISSGNAGFPKQTAAQIILRSISTYFRQNGKSPIKQVFFVLYDNESVTVYTTELGRLQD